MGTVYYKLTMRPVPSWLDSSIIRPKKMEQNMEKKNTNQCLDGLRMGDQGVQEPSNLFGEIFITSLKGRENMTTGALSSEF